MILHIYVRLYLAPKRHDVYFLSFVSLMNSRRFIFSLADGNLCFWPRDERDWFWLLKHK